MRVALKIKRRCKATDKQSRMGNATEIGDAPHPDPSPRVRSCGIQVRERPMLAKLKNDLRVILCFAHDVR